MRDFLVTPLEFAGGGVNGDDRLRPQVVARADRAVEVRGRIADADEQRLRLGVIGRGHPHRAAAVHPGIGVLGGVRLFLHDVAVEVVTFRGRARPPAPPAAFLRRGDRVPVPHLGAGGGVVGAHEPADAVLGARGADDDFVVDHQRRHRLGVPLGGVADLHRPLLLAGRLVQRHELAVERAQIQCSAGDGDATVVGPAARGRDAGVLVRVAPQRFLRVQVDGDHLVVRHRRRREVHDPVHDNRGGLEAAELRGAGLEYHPRHEILDVRRVDRGERRETVVPVVVAVHQPVTARGRLEQHVVRHDDVWRRGGRARARPLPHQGPGHQARQRDGTPPSGPLPHTHLP